MCMGKRDPAKVSLENIVFHNDSARNSKLYQRESHDICKSQILSIIANEWPGYETFKRLSEAGANADIGCEACVDTYNYAIALLDGDKPKMEELEAKYRRKEDARNS